MQRSTISGLAVRFDFKGLTQQNNEQEELDRRARLDAENKSKYWADKLKPGKVYTEWGRQQLKVHNEEVATKLGAIINNNRNWETNPTILAQVNALTDSLADNDITAKELRIEQGRQQMVKDLASGEFDPDQFEEAQKNYSNYSKTGRTTGSADHPENEFVYTSPQKFDMATYSATLASSIKSRSRTVNMGNGMLKTILEPEEEQVANVAASAINGQYAKSIRRAWERDVADGGSEFKSPLEMMHSIIKAHLGSEVKFDNIPVPRGNHGDGSEGTVNVTEPFQLYLQKKMSPQYKETIRDPGLHHFMSFSKDGKSVQLPKQGLFIQKQNGAIWNLPGFGYKSVDVDVPYGNGVAIAGKSGIKYGQFQAIADINERTLGSLFTDYDAAKNGTGAEPGDELNPEFKGKVKYKVNDKGERISAIITAGYPLTLDGIDQRQVVAYGADYNGQKAQEEIMARQQLTGIYEENGIQYHYDGITGAKTPIK